MKTSIFTFNSMSIQFFSKNFFFLYFYNLMALQFAWSCYKEIVATPFESVLDIGDIILIPKFTEDFISTIIQITKNVLNAEKPVVNASTDVVIVGDIHGNILDLFRIFAKNGYPPVTKYLFLGDYVDRGDCSLDVIVLLFIMKAMFPMHVTLLRGNHEFPKVNSLYGFRQNIESAYGNDRLWEEFNDAFRYLPLCAVIEDKIFCVHGGISDSTSINVLQSLNFPLDESSLIDTLVWSDPSETIISTAENSRGKGVQFGYKPTFRFLDNNNFFLIIRGHECVNGYRYNLDQLVLTVFSSSNYSAKGNSCGYAIIDNTLKPNCYVFSPIKRKNSLDFNYYTAVYSEQPKSEQLMMNKSLSKALRSASRQNLVPSLRRPSFLQPKVNHILQKSRLPSLSPIPINIKHV